MFQVAKLEHETTPAPFIVTYVDLNRDPTLLVLSFGKIMFYNPYSGLKYTTSFLKIYVHKLFTNNILQPPL